GPRGQRLEALRQRLAFAGRPLLLGRLLVQREQEPLQELRSQGALPRLALRPDVVERLASDDFLGPCVEVADLLLGALLEDDNRDVLEDLLGRGQVAGDRHQVAHEQGLAAEELLDQGFIRHKDSIPSTSNGASRQGSPFSVSDFGPPGTWMYLNLPR